MKQANKFKITALMQLPVELAFIVAVGGVFFVYVGVATFQFLIDGGFVYSTGADVVGECTEQDCVSLAHVLVERHEFSEVFSQESVSLSFG